MGSVEEEHRIRQTFAERKAGLVRGQQLFEDPDFPAGPSAITKGQRDYPARRQGTVWKRPQEVLTNQQPKFIVRGATRFDLNQGDSENCWFIAAAACLAASDRELLEWCVPSDQSFDKDYAGIFRFKFWRFGSWVDVIVDDRLPYKPDEDGNLKLIFARNHTETNEFWVPLLEKAYAKVNGCYDNLNGGFACDALVDFTGGISKFIDTGGVLRRTPGNLFEMLYAMMRRSSFASSHINSGVAERMSNGIYKGHAYSITKIAKIEGRNLKLLRIRNPWGDTEWNGRWSDGSREWTNLSETEKQQLELIPKEDGEFWMSFDDWLNVYDKLTICHLTPDAFCPQINARGGKILWDPEAMESEWIRGFTAGGSRPSSASFWQNPQFFVGVSPSDAGDDGVCEVVVSLMQKSHDNQFSVAISFGLYQIKGGVSVRPMGQPYPSNELTAIKMDRCAPKREVTSHFHLKPGNYVIIPCTESQNQESQFLLRVFKEMKSSRGK